MSSNRDDAEMQGPGTKSTAPTHLEAGSFFTTALLLNLAAEQGLIKQPTRTPPKTLDLLSAQRQLSSNSQNGLSRSRNSSVSSNHTNTTVYIRRRRVQKCEYLGLEFCCSTKHGWIAGQCILLWFLLIIALDQTIKQNIYSLSILLQLISSGLLFYGIIKQQPNMLIPAMVTHTMEILARMVIATAVATCYYANLDTSQFLKFMKYVSTYTFNENDLWAKDKEQKFLFWKIQLDNQCNIYEAFVHFAWNTAVVILYSGLLYGHYDYRRRMIAQQNRRRMKKTDPTPALRVNSRQVLSASSRPVFTPGVEMYTDTDLRTDADDTFVTEDFRKATANV